MEVDTKAELKDQQDDNLPANQEDEKVEKESEQVEIEQRKPLAKTDHIPEEIYDDELNEIEETTAPVDSKETKAEEDKEDKLEEPAFEILDPLSEPRQWIIGKPPEMGGDKDEFSIYTQESLGWMPMQRWGGMVFKNISKAIKESGAVDIGMEDVFGEGGGSLRDRFSTLTNQDFADAGQFMALIAELFANSPSFMIDSYLMWLDVPAKERRWAKDILNQPYKPEKEKWGLTHDQGHEIVEVFIDQNYEEFRRFFTEVLPRWVNRVRSREKEYQATHGSESPPSKQSKQ